MLKPKLRHGAMAAPRTLIGVLVSLVAWFMWMFFVCTPFGGLYYLIKSHMANTAWLRNRRKYFLGNVRVGLGGMRSLFCSC